MSEVETCVWDSGAMWRSDWMEQPGHSESGKESGGRGKKMSGNAKIDTHIHVRFDTLCGFL